MIAYFIGYFKSKVGYRLLLGDSAIMSVHVLCDVSIPDRSAYYFRELDEATVKCDPVQSLLLYTALTDSQYHFLLYSSRPLLGCL